MAEGKGIRTIPPGFTRGLRLPGEEEDEAGLDELDRVRGPSDVGQGEVVSTIKSHNARWLMRFT